MDPPEPPAKRSSRTFNTRAIKCKTTRTEPHESVCWPSTTVALSIVQYYNIAVIVTAVAAKWILLPSDSAWLAVYPSFLSLC